MARESKEIFRMVLFVAGEESNSQAARKNLHSFCDRYLSGRAEVEIIDVLVDYRKALEWRVLITPALVVLHPLPGARILGTLEDTARILAALQLSENGLKP
jgi:circadian clock protein KaiB